MNKANIEEVSLVATSLEGFEVSVLDPHKLREELLSNAATIKTANTAEGAKAAVDAAGELKGLAKRVRQVGKLRREPFNNAASLIIKTENEFCEQLETESKRLEKVAADFQVAETRRIEAERAETARKAKEEQDRLAKLEQERIEAERKQREAQEAHQRELERMERERQEAEKRAAEAKTKAQREKAAAEQARIERERIEAQRVADEQKKLADAEAERIRREQADAEIDADFAEQEAASALEQTASKPKGGSVRTGWKIEVKDLDALYKAFPRCVKLQANLQEIKDTIRDLERQADKDGIEDFIPTIPGVVITEETKIAARSVAPGLRLK